MYYQCITNVLPIFKNVLPHFEKLSRIEKMNLKYELNYVKSNFTGL